MNGAAASGGSGPHCRLQPYASVLLSNRYESNGASPGATGGRAAGDRGRVGERHHRHGPRTTLAGEQPVPRRPAACMTASGTERHTSEGDAFPGTSNLRYRTGPARGQEVPRRLQPVQADLLVNVARGVALPQRPTRNTAHRRRGEQGSSARPKRGRAPPQSPQQRLQEFPEHLPSAHGTPATPRKGPMASRSTNH